MAALKQNLKSNQSKVYELNRRHAILGKPTKLINNTVQQLLDSNVSSKAIVHNVISDLMSKKYFHKHVGKCITKNVTLLPQVADHFEPKIYGEICHKFRGWICLQQLDMCATVSFQALDIIRKIEFVENGKKNTAEDYIPVGSSLEDYSGNLRGTGMISYLTC